jgi:hypothetical protein
LSRYDDELMIPQLVELALDYGVDGVWIDGECWATKPDYSPDGLRAFCNATGIEHAPRKPGDPGWFEFQEFWREEFRKHIRHVVDTLHNRAPNFEVASNWAFSSFMPEPVSADLDFISGDYTLQNSLSSARLEGRCMTRQGKPWDLMAWGFSSKIFQPTPEENDPTFSTKTGLQLQQEAAVVLALGGGFQAYFTQRRDGAVRSYQMEAMAQAASFCRARQVFCHRAEAVPQVALLNSRVAYYHKNQALFAPGEVLSPLRGVLQGLLDNQYSVEVLSEHHLHGKMKQYGLIVVPEWEVLDAGFRDELLAYTRAGGSLLLVGPQPAALFEKELGVSFSSPLQEKCDRYLGFNGAMSGLGKIAFRQVWLRNGVDELGRVHVENDTVTPSDPAASIAALGSGKIAAVYFSFGERYMKAQTALAREFLGALAHELFPYPAVEVRGSHLVDVVLNRKDGHLALNLVNTGGPHANRDVYTYDEIPALGPLEVMLRLESKPESVVLQPGARPVEWDWSDGELRLTLPRLEIHEIIWLEG